VPDPLLAGNNPLTHAVAVRHSADDAMVIYRREAGAVSTETHQFFPFFFLSDVSYLERFPARHWIKELGGTNHFRFACAFPSWSVMWDAVHHLVRQYAAATHTNVESYAELPILHLRADPAAQFLMQSGITLFKGMEFRDVHRLQLDIETYTTPGFKFSNAQRIEDRIIIIALSDNRGWSQILSGDRLDEAALLRGCAAVIRERDPDVIEGHNILGFDFPYILRRCELLNVEFGIGRDGSPPRAFDSRSQFAERLVEHPRYDVAGRHVIDTYHLVQGYDAVKRTLESYGLKYAAKHFGFAKEDRIYIAGERIPWYWDNEPDLLKRYAMDDVTETRLLSELLLPPSFYLTQLLPYSFSAVTTLGASAKIESLLVREYLRRRHSLPSPDPAVQTTGGYTDIFYTGILGPVIDADIESLYPSIMLTGGIAPKSEALGVFLPLLRELTSRRLAAKRRMEATDGDERAKFDAMQSSLKILINSFYGYLGYSRALFSDAGAADKVTQTGQEILRRLIASIASKRGTVVEVDTDGIFFVPPPFVKSERDERKYLQDAAAALPSGINLAMKGRYRSILSYKMKNYALRGYDEKIVIRGSSLTSRNIEMFGRNFIQQCIEALLNANIGRLHALYVNLTTDIREHKLSIGDFARTETLKESVDDYTAAVEKGERNRNAAYEVALASRRGWKRGDRISYYITGTESGVRSFANGRLAEEWNPEDPDENSAFYLKRLDEFAKKFDVFFASADFRKIFSMDDLFGFTAEGIEIVTRKLEEEMPAELREADAVEPGIWLDA
jgi:DNA polymerase elongation subunit (family B)